MSSGDKIPLLKDETDSESKESDTDSEIDEAEETFEHMKLQERRAKEDDYVELKSSDSSTQELSTESIDLQESDPSATSGKLKQSSIPASSGVQPDPTPLSAENSGLHKDASRTKQSGENVESEATESTLGQSPPASESPQRLISPLVPPRECDEIQKMSQELSDSKNSSPTDRQNTLSGVPSIVSEVASFSGEGVQRDEAGILKTDQPPNYAAGFEKRSSEASDSNIPDIPEDDQAPTPPPTRTSFNPTSSRGYGDRTTVAQLQKEEVDRKVGPSLGIPTCKRYEDVHPKTSPDLSEAHLFSREEFDKMPQGENLHTRNEQAMLKTEETENAAIGSQTDEERIRSSDCEGGSSDKRNEAGSSSGGKQIVGTFKSKMESGVKKADSKMNHPLQSGEDLKVSPKEKTGKKFWPKTSFISCIKRSVGLKSKDSAVNKKAQPTSPCEVQSPKLMETEDDSLEKMDTDADDNAAINPVLPESDAAWILRRQAFRSSTQGSSEEENILEPVYLKPHPEETEPPGTSTTSPEPKPPLPPRGQAEPKPPLPPKSQAFGYGTRRTSSDEGNINETLNLPMTFEELHPPESKPPLSPRGLAVGYGTQGTSTDEGSIKVMLNLPMTFEELHPPGSSTTSPESKPPLSPRGQAFGYGTQGTSAGGGVASTRSPEPKPPLPPRGQAFGCGTSTTQPPIVPRKGRKSKRSDEKLTNSPPSDEIQGTPKKARPDIEASPTRRTRHDSNDIPERVAPDSTHVSDSSPSDASVNEDETAL